MTKVVLATNDLPSSASGNMKVLSQRGIPWALAFSFARAIQQPALEIWQGQEAQVGAAQRDLCHRARCNSATLHGEYSIGMEVA